MNIKSVHYGTLDWGAGAGFVAFQVTLAGDGTEVSPQELIKKINDTRKTSFPKIVRFIVQDEVDEGQLMAIIKTLGDWGYSVQTVTNGQAWHPFMASTYNIVSLSSASWLGFVCNELWFDPSTDDGYSDPILPGGKIEGSLYYIVPGSGVWDYITKSSIPWAVLPRPSKNIRLDIEL